METFLRYVVYLLRGIVAVASSPFPSQNSTNQLRLLPTDGGLQVVFPENIKGSYEYRPAGFGGALPAESISAAVFRTEPDGFADAGNGFWL